MSTQTTLKPLSLRGNFAWATVGNIVYSACSWLMLAIIAKVGSPAMVGQLSLSLAVIQPIIAFSQLNLSQVQTTDARKEYRFGDYLALRLITNGLALLVLLGLALWGGYDRTQCIVLVLVGISAVFDAFGDVTFGLLRQREVMDRIAISMAAEGVLSLALLSIGMFCLHSLLWAAAGYALASALVVVCYDIPCAVHVLRTDADCAENLVTLRGRFALPRPHWKIRTLLKLAWLALPLGTIMLLIALNNNISRYFVHHTLGAHGLGIFSALISFVAAGRIVILALGQSASPRLARHYADGDRQKFTGLLLRLVIIGAVVGVAAPAFALVAGRQILTFFYTAEYARHLNVFVLYLAAGGAGYVASFLGYGITAARYFKIQTVTLGALSIVTVVTCAWLIPAYGAEGAGWSALLVAFGNILGNLLILRHALRALPVDRMQVSWSAVKLPTVRTDL